MIQRVWEWLKDHPEKTAKHIADSLKEDRQGVSSRLHELRVRGMVTARRGKDGLLEWTVSRLTDGVYELLPKPRVKKVETVQPKPDPGVAQKGLEYPETTLMTAEEEAEYRVKSMTLTLAHAIYLRLRAYFDPVL